jgi:hypothetical protein
LSSLLSTHANKKVDKRIIFLSFFPFLWEAQYLADPTYSSPFLQAYGDKKSEQFLKIFSNF